MKTTVRLFMMLVFIASTFFAQAQSGTTPLVGSTHNYSVTAGSASNTLAWTVTGGTSGTDYVINSGASGQTVNITWKTAGSYTVKFTETDPTTHCSTIKTLAVTVSSNSFDVSTASPSASCNAASGVADYANANATTSITIPVTMASGLSTWSPNWEFTFTLTPSTGVTIANVVASAGTLSGSGPYTVTGIPSTSGAGLVDITMDVTGTKIDLHTVILTITSAKELQYNTPDKDTDDWTATYTINAVPNTSAITTD